MPATAGAAVVTLDGGTAVFTAAPGEVNDVEGQLNEDGSLQISDANNPVRTSGIPGCQGSGQSIDCLLAATALVVDLGDGDDKASVTADGSMPLTILGGDGEDQLTGTGDAVKLAGGAGDDLLDASGARPSFSGGAGDDLFANHAGAKADCNGGGSDRALIPAKLTLAGCAAPMKCKVKLAKGQTLKSFVAFGLAFTATCPRPAAISWTLNSGAKLVGTRNWPADEGGYPLLSPGSQSIKALVGGASARKALLRGKKATVTLGVSGTDGLALLRPVRVRVKLR